MFISKKTELDNNKFKENLIELMTDIINEQEISEYIGN